MFSNGHPAFFMLCAVRPMRGFEKYFAYLFFCKSVLSARAIRVSQLCHTDGNVLPPAWQSCDTQVAEAWKTKR